MPEIEIQKGEGETREKFWPSLSEIRKELRHLFHEFFSGHWLHFPGHHHQETRVPADFQPCLNIHSQDSELVVETALPGLDRKDVHVTVTRDSLTLSGEYRWEEKSEKDHYFQFEMQRGSFYRKLRLPAEVDAAGARAELKDGLLKVRMPLVDADCLRRVEIQ
jgi:HSP20 family protein